METNRETGSLRKGGWTCGPKRKLQSEGPTLAQLFFKQRKDENKRRGKILIGSGLDGERVFGRDKKEPEEIIGGPAILLKTQGETSEGKSVKRRPLPLGGGDGNLRGPKN